MLDDYIDELALAIANIAEAINTKELDKAIDENQRVIKVCRIMQATNLLIQANDLLTILKAKQFKLAQAKIEEMIEQQSLLVSFAQAI